VSLISIRNIEKSFKTGAGETFVLRRITMEVGKGDFITIMGPSGAGKSTLLAILGMLDGDWSGEYYLLHEAVHAMRPKDRIALNRQYIGFVFQQYHLLDDLTVYENLEIPLSYRNVKRKEREAIVADTLDRFQIVGKKDLYPNQLSGGQQQLVAVARAIIAEPKVILADEPTGSLHTSQGKMIMDLLKKLNEEGTTIIQVTHNDAWAAYGSRIIQLQDGMYGAPLQYEPSSHDHADVPGAQDHKLLAGHVAVHIDQLLGQTRGEYPGRPAAGDADGEAGLFSTTHGQYHRLRYDLELTPLRVDGHNAPVLVQVGHHGVQTQLHIKTVQVVDEPLGIFRPGQVLIEIVQSETIVDTLMQQPARVLRSLK